MQREQHYASIVPPRQGLLAFAPKCKTPWKVVPYGFDPGFWCPEAGTVRDERGFICVAGPTAPGNRIHYLKGVDLLLQVAERMPEARFHVVGLADPDAYTTHPANVHFTGRLDPVALREAYRGAAFYLQWSMSEGMPNALCEAMLCGCVPHVSDVSSMPDIVAGIGQVLAQKDPALAADTCRAMIATSTDERLARSGAARSRISERYTMHGRARALATLIGTN